MATKRPSSKKPSRSKTAGGGKPTAKPRKKPRPASAARKPAAPAPAVDEEEEAELVSSEPPRAEETTPTRPFPLEIDTRQLEASLKSARDELVHWANKGRYTKVRIKFRGKQVLPDLPLAAVVAAEGLSFYLAGPLRALAMTAAGGALLKLELINDSEKVVDEGKQAILSGELDQAISLFRRAISMDRDNAGAQLNLGVALKLKGDREGARQALEKARTLDPKGSIGAEAERVLSSLPPAAMVVVPG